MFNHNQSSKSFCEDLPPDFFFLTYQRWSSEILPSFFATNLQKFWLFIYCKISKKDHVLQTKTPVREPFENLDQRTPTSCHNPFSSYISNFSPNFPVTPYNNIFHLFISPTSNPTAQNITDLILITICTCLCFCKVHQVSPLSLSLNSLILIGTYSR